MGVEGLRRALAAHQRVFLDTMVLAYLLDEHPIYADLAEAVMTLVEEGSLSAVTSALTLAEILTGPAKAGNIQALRDYELYVTHFPNLAIWPVDAALARQVAQVRAATGLRTPDAVQLAVAASAGVDAIVGNDRSWRNKVGDTALYLLDDFR